MTKPANLSSSSIERGGELAPRGSLPVACACDKVGSVRVPLSKGQSTTTGPRVAGLAHFSRNGPWRFAMSVPRPVRLPRRLPAIAAFLVAVGFCTLGHAGGNAMAPEKESASGTLWLYVGTYTGGKTPSEGIYLLELDLASGRLTSKGAVARLKDPSFLAIHPSRKFLYAVNELGEFNGKKGGGVSAWRSTRRPAG